MLSFVFSVRIFFEGAPQQSEERTEFVCGLVDKRALGDLTLLCVLFLFFVFLSFACYFWYVFWVYYFHYVFRFSVLVEAYY